MLSAGLSASQTTVAIGSATAARIAATTAVHAGDTARVWRWAANDAVARPRIPYSLSRRRGRPADTGSGPCTIIGRDAFHQ